MARFILPLFCLSLVAGLAACRRDAAPAQADDPVRKRAAGAGASVQAPAITGASAGASPSDDALTSGQPPSTIPIPPADTPTPDIAAGAQIVYLCEDGNELHVVYSGNSAKFTLADGRVVTLPRAQSASKGGGDVYVGEAVGLQRLGNVVQVEQDEGARRVCVESGGNA